MPLPFNKVLDIKLIQCVKKYPILYDHNSPNYMDHNEREVAWQKIGDEIKRPARLAKARWINIRDMMRKKVRERSKKTRVYNYKYEQELEFLTSLIKETVGDYPNQHEDFSEYLVDNSEKQLPMCEFDDTTERHSASDEDNAHDVKPLILRTKESVGRFEHCDVGENSNEVTVQQELNLTDPLESFLITIGTTLKTFSPYYLNQAKSKIFTIVQEYELQQIVDKTGQPDGRGT